jgi:hypothetical protein
VPQKKRGTRLNAGRAAKKHCINSAACLPARIFWQAVRAFFQFLFCSLGLEHFPLRGQPEQLPHEQPFFLLTCRRAAAAAAAITARIRIVVLFN